MCLVGRIGEIDNMATAVIQESDFARIHTVQLCSSMPHSSELTVHTTICHHAGGEGAVLINI